VWKIQVNVHDHVAALHRFLERAARESRTEHKSASAQAFVLNIYKIHFNTLRGAGRGRSPVAAGYMNHLSVKVRLGSAQCPVPFLDLHENLTANQVLEHALRNGRR
jgi:hypothetical protein